MLKRLVIVFLISVFAILTLAACNSEDQKLDGEDNSIPTPTPDIKVGVRVGDLAPDFEFSETMNFEGLNATKLSDFKGKVVFLNFWVTWCPNCQREAPHIETLHQGYKDQDFVVIAVDIGEGSDTVRNYLAKNGYTFPVVLDKGKQITKDYHIFGTPTTFVLDKDGIIRGLEIGYRNWSNPEQRWLIDYWLSK